MAKLDPLAFMLKKIRINNIVNILFYFLILFAIYCSLIIGLSTDEYFHHMNGLVRFEYLKSLGEFEEYIFRNNQFYPGLYDTVSYSLGTILLLINKSLYANNIDIVMHSVNVAFSLLSILGLYSITKIFFNKNIAILTCLLTLLNPFFFGHMGMNSKDIVIFFSLIWFCYFFFKYLNSEENAFKNLIYVSFFIGFGCGVRLTFLVIIFPVVLYGLIYLFKKFKFQYLYLAKRITLHSLISFIIITFLVILCWPHMINEIKNGNFVTFFTLIIKNTISWMDGPMIGLINGSFYEVFNTPKTYFIDVIKFRLPFYSTILIIVSYLLVFTKNLTIKNDIKNFNEKFILVNVLAFFPIILAIVLDVNIYDNLRLFLFVLPFFSLVAAFSLNHLLNNFKNSLKIKTSLVVILFLFSISFYRFISLTPYQYAYVNYSYPIYKDSVGKFEHDYWGATYKELVLRIKETYTQSEIKNLKITNCSGDPTLLYYLNRYLNQKKIYRGKDEIKSSHIVIIDRTYLNIRGNHFLKDLVNDKGQNLALLMLNLDNLQKRNLEKIVRTPTVKQTCFNLYNYKGTNDIIISRGGLPLSIFRKINR